MRSGTETGRSGTCGLSLRSAAPRARRAPRAPLRRRHRQRRDNPRMRQHVPSSCSTSSPIHFQGLRSRAHFVPPRRKRRMRSQRLRRSLQHLLMYERQLARPRRHACARSAKVRSASYGPFSGDYQGQKRQKRRRNAAISISSVQSPVLLEIVGARSRPNGNCAKLDISGPARGILAATSLAWRRRSSPSRARGCARAGAVDPETG
jgi:hypothetical protein